MKGLLKKALEIRKERESLETRDTEESGIPPAERDEILKEINKIVEKQRIQLKSDEFSLKPLKKDTVVPLFVNISAIVILAAGIYLLFSFFNQKEMDYVSSTGTLVTAESKVIETLKKESEEKLNEKNREISRIQNKLGEIIKERDTLKTSMNEKIRKKEIELKNKMEKLLEAEKAKLRGQGLSERDIQKKLQEIQNQMKEQNSKSLEEFKKKTEEEFKKREAEIAKEVSQYQKQLDQAKVEAEKLKNFYKQRENELRAKYESEKAAIIAREKGVSEKLSSLKEIQKKEDFAFDQIFSMYKSTINDIQAGNYTNAKKRISSLESFLKQPDIASLPAIQKRKNVENLTIEAFQSLIEERKKTEDLEKYKKQIDNALNIAARADKFYKKRQYNRARYEYERAITSISSISKLYKNLNAIQSRELSEIISKNREQVDSLQNQIAELRRTLSDTRHELTMLKEKLKTEQERFIKLTESLKNLEALYSRNPGSSSEAASVKEKLLSLLETKIIVKQIITSDSIRKKYPDLYNKLEEYFDTLAKENRREGQAEVIDHFKELLTYLTVLKASSNNTRSSVTERLPIANFLSGDPNETAKYIDIIDKLKQLLK